MAFDRPWFIAGGWAMDLFLGWQTRAHKDVEIAVLRQDQQAIRRHLVGWSWHQVMRGPAGSELLPWTEGEWLLLSTHELHGRWVEGMPSALEVLLNEAAGDVWRLRRNPAITRPLHRLGRRSPDGLPYLSPEIVLLYKAKAPRTEDVMDFGAVSPLLEEEPRRWLLEALAGCHPWLAVLTAAGPA